MVGVQTRSVGYCSEEELRKDLEILDEPCKICGSIVKTCFNEPIGSNLKKENICFSCNHWLRIENDLQNPKRFIINGGSYYLGNGKQNSYFKGFGGNSFKIKRHGGDQIITTSDLWHQGDVPEVFKNRIKDNAVFVK